MNRLFSASLLAATLAFSAGTMAQADTLSGVIVSYESGNQGTDMTVRTSDGKSHALWFDNMKKPSFAGASLPWCPEFPCDGWPKALVLNKTRVMVTTIHQTVDGRALQSPTKIALQH